MIDMRITIDVIISVSVLQRIFLTNHGTISSEVVSERDSFIKVRPCLLSFSQQQRSLKLDYCFCRTASQNIHSNKHKKQSQHKDRDIQQLNNWSFWSFWSFWTFRIKKLLLNKGVIFITFCQTQKWARLQQSPNTSQCYYFAYYFIKTKTSNEVKIYETCHLCQKCATLIHRSYLRLTLHGICCDASAPKYLLPVSPQCLHTFVIFFIFFIFFGLQPFAKKNKTRGYETFRKYTQLNQ